jgi:hypothetical protein
MQPTLPNKPRGILRVNNRRARNLIERFFNKIKQCQRVTTRYDKLAVNYLAFIELASIRIWLRAEPKESRPRRIQRTRNATLLLRGTHFYMNSLQPDALPFIATKHGGPHGICAQVNGIGRRER